MKLRKCMAMLLAALLLLGAMPVWAAEADTAEADTAEPVTENAPAEIVTEEAPEEVFEATLYEAEPKAGTVVASGNCGDYIYDENGDIVEDEDGWYLRSDVVWTLYSDGLLSIQGTGGSDLLLEEEYSDQVKKLEIGEGVTNFEHFQIHGFPNLTEISLPETLKGVSDSAFYNCPELKTVTIPKSVTEIGTFAFGYRILEQTNMYGRKMAGKVPGFTISGYDNTAGETYAKQHGFGYQSLGAEPVREMSAEEIEQRTERYTHYGSISCSISGPVDLTIYDRSGEPDLQVKDGMMLGYDGESYPFTGTWYVYLPSEEYGGQTPRYEMTATADGKVVMTLCHITPTRGEPLGPYETFTVDVKKGDRLTGELGCTSLQEIQKNTMFKNEKPIASENIELYSYRYVYLRDWASAQQITIYEAESGKVVVQQKPTTGDNGGYVSYEILDSRIDAGAFGGPCYVAIILPSDTAYRIDWTPSGDYFAEGFGSYGDSLDAYNEVSIAEFDPLDPSVVRNVAYGINSVGLVNVGEHVILELPKSSKDKVAYKVTKPDGTVCVPDYDIYVEGEKPTFKLGDVTGDGKITSADALQIQRYVVKRSSVLDDNAEKKVRDAADVTGEGDITSADALQIQRYVVQRPSVLDGK